MSQQCNKENMQKWIEALRSGIYTQANGALRKPRGPIPAEYTTKFNDYAYCCLGVACELFCEEKERELDADADDIHYDSTDIWYDNSLLPEDVQKWLGITNSNPYLTDKFWTHPAYNSETEILTRSASSWNDDIKADFNKIADLIEDTFLKD